ncbi:MAG: flagellar FlbD family protein [Acidimicrobiales bacterium]
MIVLTNLHGERLAINDELIERLEGDRETRVTLVGGARYIVSEPVEEIVRRCRRNRAEVLALSRRLDARPAPEAGSGEGPDDEDDPARLDDPGDPENFERGLDGAGGPGHEETVGDGAGELRLLRPVPGDAPPGGRR